jgi:Protein of unknown function (DUF3134)
MKRSPLISQPRTEPAPIMSSSTDQSMLDWLESTGRLMDREVPVDPALLEEMDEVSEALVGNIEIDDSFEEDDFDED